MTTCLSDVEDEVLRRIATANELFVFLDYDGTLSRIAPTPAQAVPLPGTAELLRSLVAAPRVQVAIVSGRTIANVLHVLDVPGLYYVGVHGAEVRLPDGESEAVEATATVRSVLPGILRRLRERIADRPGVWLEEKGAVVACHYRLAAPADAAAAARAVSDLAYEYRRRGAPIEFMSGHAVAEIRPAYVSKGKTVCTLLATHGRGALSIYIGDDQTDEDAFRQLPANAITVRVGPPGEPTQARYRVETPDDVQRFLRAVRACRAHLGRAADGASSV
jgi:trehalose 6-phosphate phosphatase